MIPAHWPTRHMLPPHSKELMTSDEGTDPREEATANSLNRPTMATATPETLQVMVTSSKDDSKEVLATMVMEEGRNVIKEVEMSSTRKDFHRPHPPNARSLFMVKSINTLCLADLIDVVSSYCLTSSSQSVNAEMDGEEDGLDVGQIVGKDVGEGVGRTEIVGPMVG